MNINLNTATNEQLDAYREQIAKLLDIDPLMLDYIWMDNADTGLRNRVLYAKRGTAEILRHKRGITITSLVMHQDDGFVMFTATGEERGNLGSQNGRQEIAVGAAYLEGIKADKRAHAVMTAQTRAVRRLTLQFVGGGILDETEVQAQSGVSLPTAAFGAQLQGSPTVIPPVPTVTPSAAPGKDVTPASELPPLPALGFKYLAPPPMVAPSAVPSKDVTEGVEALKKLTEKNIEKIKTGETKPSQGPDITKELMAGDPGFDMGEHIAKVYEEGAKALAAMPVPHAIIPTVTFEPQPEVLATAAAVAPPEPKKRTRRSRNTVTLGSVTQMEIPPGLINAAGKITPLVAPGQSIQIGPDCAGNITRASVPPATANEPEQGTIGNGDTHHHPALAELTVDTIRELKNQLLSATPKPGQKVVVDVAPETLRDLMLVAPAQAPTMATAAVPQIQIAPAPQAPTLSPEKAKEYRDRLSKYSSSILPGAGMMPSEGIGGVTMKLRKFATVFTGAADSTKMTEDEFDALFEFLDANQSNPAFLVEYINKAIGVKS